MDNLSELFTNLVMIALDMISLSLVVVAVLIVAVAIYGMARNRSAAWDNLLFIPIVLFLGALLLQYYPPMVMKSVRIGVQGSRDEAQLLRDEMQQWVPDVSFDAGQPPEPTTQTVIETSSPTTVILSTPFPTVPIAVTVLPTRPPATPVPLSPSSTPTPIPTMQPTACVVNLASGTTMACPPTPSP